MPWKPKRPCTTAGCPELTSGGPCERHRKARQQASDAQRGTASERGYDSRWHKARTSWLKSHPICEECVKQGRVVAATVVDHVIPHKGDQALFWDQANWSAKCKRCHDSATARYDGGFGHPMREKPR